MTKLTLIAFCLISAGPAGTLSKHSSWTASKSQLGRHFFNTAFAAAKSQVDKHNPEYDQGLNSYRQQFAPLDIFMEIAKKIFRVSSSFTDIRVRGEEQVPTVIVLPPSLDLRISKCMPPIMTRGNCGSCWAFAATNPIDFQYCNLNNLPAPIPFSVQQLIDCVGTNGCNGGNVGTAWTYLKTTGLMTSADYPYISGYASVSSTCALDTRKRRTFVQDYRVINHGPAVVNDIKQALYTYGPVVVIMDATSPDFKSYTGPGIFKGTCTTDSNHWLTIVGYGTDSAGVDYWIVRNHWGISRGMQGYWLMQAGVNHCGIENYPVYPIVRLS